MNIKIEVMKSILIIISLIAANCSWSQFKDQIHNVSFLQLGSGTRIPEEGSKHKFTKTNHLMVEWDWYNPEIGWWMEFDASFLGNVVKTLSSKEAKESNNIDSLSVTNGFNGAFLGTSLGWMFNNNNPISIGHASTKIGMGFTLGGYGFESETFSKAAVIFGPELGSFTNISDRMDVFAKWSLPILVNRGYNGFKPNFDVKVSYRVVKWLGFSISGGLESYRFNDEARWGTEENPYQEKFKFKYIQFGACVIID